MDKELRKIIRRIRARGYDVVPAGKHQKVKNSEGKTIYTLPTTPSGHLWRVRLEKQLRQRGLID